MFEQTTKYKNHDGEIVEIVKHRLAHYPFHIEVAGRRLEGYLATFTLDEAQRLLDDIADELGWRVFDVEYEKLCSTPRAPLKVINETPSYIAPCKRFNNAGRMWKVEVNARL